MRIIPKFQLNGVIRSDNTHVVKPLYVEPLKYKPKEGEFFIKVNGKSVLVKPKNEQVSQDNRTQYQKRQDLKRSKVIRKKMEDQKQQEEGAKGLEAMTKLVSPSTYVGPMLDNSDRPYAERVLGGQGSGDAVTNLALDIATPMLGWGAGYRIGEGVHKVYTYTTNKINPYLTKMAVKKGIHEALKYKSMPLYQDLIRKAAAESRSSKYGTGDFTLRTFEIDLPEPQVKIETIPNKNASAEYVPKTNTVRVDPSKIKGFKLNRLAGFHEGLHQQRVGDPSIINYKGPLWREWRDTNSNTAYDRFYNSEELKDVQGILFNAPKYIEKKVDEAVNSEVEAINPEIAKYLRVSGELQANGLEAGKAIGLKPFLPYPGTNSALKAINKARAYNYNLFEVKANSEEEIRNFWNILTGQYTPAILTPAIIYGNKRIQSQKNKMDN